MNESKKGLRAIDTNILIRALVSDEPGQFEAVKSLIRESERADEVLYVTTVVLTELVWVLRQRYRLNRSALADRLDQLLASPTFQLERELVVAQALDQYRRGRADFADYLIGAIAQEAGCRDTVTFDQKLRETPGFTVLE